jgi:flagellar basal body-associated protein FliL
MRVPEALQPEEPPIGLSPENPAEPPPLTEPVRPAPRRNKLIFIGIPILLVILIVVAVWQYHSISAFVTANLSYIFVLLPSFLAAGTIRFKDWNNYRPHWIRWAIIGVIAVSAVLGLIYQHGQRLEKASTAEENRRNLQLFQAQALAAQNQTLAAQQAQAANTKQYVDALQTFSTKISDLQTKAATEELQKQLAVVKGELENTQKMLQPAPKAELTFTFCPYPRTPLQSVPVTPITSVTLPQQPDGSVHVQFEVLNNSEVDANDGIIVLYISDACKFAKEPQKFTRVEGTTDNQRLLQFAQIPALTTSFSMTADVIPPPFGNKFAIGILFRCKTCILTKALSQGIVTVTQGI